MGVATGKGGLGKGPDRSSRVGGVGVTWCQPYDKVRPVRREREAERGTQVSAGERHVLNQSRKPNREGQGRRGGEVQRSVGSLLDLAVETSSTRLEA